MSEIRASIDIGSNSVLLLLAHVSPFREIAKLSEVTGLGKGLDKNGVFAEGPLADTWQALKKYAELCVQHGLAAENIIATATEASRVAKNAPAFYAKVKAELGIDVKIITGKAEAALTTQGILFNTRFDTPEVVVMDIGGASTEFIRVDTQTLKIKDSVSLKAGAVRATDWLREGIFEREMGRVLSADLASYHSATLHCVAGTMTSLGNMHLGNQTFVEDEVHGMRMPIAALEALYQRCRDWTPQQFLADYPFLGKRAEAIRGGLILSHTLLQHFKVREIVISTYGLRYGSFLAGEIADEYLA